MDADSWMTARKRGMIARYIDRQMDGRMDRWVDR
jgi:hypothetical protein